MSRQRLSRLAGALYILMSVPGALALVYFPRVFVVAGDAAATASRIAAAPGVYRLGVLSDLICAVFAIPLAMVLYELFKDVHRGQARLLIGLVFGMVAIGLVNTVLMAGPLVTTSGAAYLSVFEKPQLDALTLGFWGLRSQGVHVATMYWGLWLLPLGALTWRSGFLPRFLGAVVFIAGCSYVIDAFAYFLLPSYASMIANASALPQALGEGGFVLYTMIKGVRESWPKPPSVSCPVSPRASPLAAGQ